LLVWRMRPLYHGDRDRPTWELLKYHVNRCYWYTIDRFLRHCRDWRRQYGQRKRGQQRRYPRRHGV